MTTFRHTLRSLLRQSGFSAVVVLTLALGIGATAAVFSVLDGVVLHPLPFAHADRLMALYATSPQANRNGISYPNFQDLGAARAFETLAMWKPEFFTLTSVNGVEQLAGQRVTASYFSVLGVQPLIGRAFDTEEDRPGGRSVVILGESAWRTRYAADTRVLGQTLTLDGRAYSVVGVMPDKVRILAPELMAANDVFIPLGQYDDPLFVGRGSASDLNVIGRLSPGASLEQARIELTSLARNLELTYPEFNAGVGVDVVPLAQVVAGDLRVALVALFGAIGCVLLIACANVATLLLARSTARRREFSVRLALGAVQRDLLRHVLADGVVLAAAGGVLGLAIAPGLTQALLLALPTPLPPVTDVSLSSTVVGFVAIVSMASALVIGLVPALAIAKQATRHGLTSGARGGVTGHRAQHTFVVAELALTLVLLSSAGLMLQTVRGLLSVDPGFVAEGVHTFRTSLSPEHAATPEAIRATYRDLTDRLSTIPGVPSASLVFGSLPMTGNSTAGFRRDDEPPPATPAAGRVAQFNAVGPGYFTTMTIPLLRGRAFASQDDSAHPLVTIVDDTLANAVFPNQNPIGQRIQFGGFPGALEIVGVVGNVKQAGLDLDEHATIRAHFYIPIEQLNDILAPITARGIGAVVLSPIEATALMTSIGRAVAEVDPGAVVHDDGPLAGHVDRSLAPRRFALYLLGAFATAALLLSAIGIYGVVSFAIGQRTREMGLRSALGATPSDVLRLVVGDGQKLAVTGVAVGLLAAVFAARLLSGLLYRVSPTDPWTLGVVSLLLFAMTALACAIPARRASRVDPVTALRAE